MDEIIRPANSALLFKNETTPGTDASPAGNVDAIPFEEGSVQIGNPFTEQTSNEANGTMGQTAPMIIGQPVPVRFRFQIKGAGVGAVYSSSVKPPHHAVYQSSGLRGFFQAAVTATALASGTTTSATLASPFAATAQLYRGMPLVLGGSPVAGATPFVSDYTAGRVATLTDEFGSALSSSHTAAIPLNWTYAPTSPKDSAARATDHPASTVYYYEDGLLKKVLGVRGQLTITGQNAGVLTGEFVGSGIYGGESDAAIPSNLAVAGHTGPLLVQGQALNLAVAANRKALHISQFSLAFNANVVSPGTPNSPYGFEAAEIGKRQPLLTVDPLRHLVAVRDTLTQMQNATQFTGIIRAGAQAGNRIGLTMPILQIASREDGTRDIFRTEQLGLRPIITAAQDAQTRDNDIVLCFS